MSERNWRLPFIVGLVFRVFLPWVNHGFRYMDEHWQVIEPANSLLGRAWSITTEWQEGLRSWIYPGLVSGVMRFAEALGFQNPIWINSFIRMIHGIISAAAIPLVYLAVKKLSQRSSLKESAALGAAWFTALWPYSVYCGFHTHGEMLGALFVLLGVACPILIKKEFWGYLTSGAAFGCALALKIDVAVAGLGFGLWQIFHRRFQRAAYLALGVLPLVLIVGLVDRLTWGTWFQSVLGHGKANLVDSVGNQWGVSPWYMHVFYYFDITGALVLVGSLLTLLQWRRTPEPLRGIWFMNAFFVAVYCTIPHKEKRFLAPLIYTSITAAFSSLALMWTSLKKSHRVYLRPALAVLILIHGGVNIFTYIIHQPWWDRIEAIHNAGSIPGIEKMISPQWPAAFYFPRQIPSENTGTEQASIKKAVKGVRDLGVAVDWKDLSKIENLGFRCKGWPSPRPSGEDIPWAYHCIYKD